MQISKIDNHFELVMRYSESYPQRSSLKVNALGLIFFLSQVLFVCGLDTCLTKKLNRWKELNPSNMAQKYLPSPYLSFFTHK